MRPKIVLILSLFFMFTLGFSSQIQASSGSDYVIFRANISPLYIENQSVIIQVLAVPYHENKPIAATCEIYIKITGLNINYSFDQTYNVQAGKSETLYLPSLQAGHYEIFTYASYKGIKSKAIDEDFGVTQAPVPYSLIITKDGGEIHFKSLRLNESGVPDPKYPFTLEIFLDSHGYGEALVASYTNVTNITIKVPASWKTGILYVEVVDCYGWHNGMSINLAKMQFSGVPLSYDYEYLEREPLKSHRWEYIIASVIVFVVLLYFAVSWLAAKSGVR